MSTLMFINSLSKRYYIFDWNEDIFVFGEKFLQNVSATYMYSAIILGGVLLKFSKRVLKILGGVMQKY